MPELTGSKRIERWPAESREAAELVIKQYGEPDEATDSQLLWLNRGKWKRIVASKTCGRITRGVFTPRV